MLMPESVMKGQLNRIGLARIWRTHQIFVGHLGCNDFQLKLNGFHFSPLRAKIRAVFKSFSLLELPKPPGGSKGAL